MEYTHLTEKERIKIELYLSEGYSRSAIAKKIGRSKSTVCREISRNTNKRGRGAKRYSADRAQKKYKGRIKTKQKKEVFTLAMKREVKTKLEGGWTPELISGRAKLEGRDMVSHECIYTWIYKMQRSNRRADKEFKRLWRQLPQAGRQRRKRSRAYKQRGMVPNRVPMEKRPLSAKNRSRNGHMEADLVIGKDHGSALLVMTDRKLRYTFIRQIKTRNSKHVGKKIQGVVDGNKWIRSITFDNDLAFSEHEKIPVDTFFTRPYCSQDKGSVENKNKVIRMKYPKGFDFNEISYQKIIRLQKWINDRPMKMFKYKSPKELFEKAFKENI